MELKLYFSTFLIYVLLAAQCLWALRPACPLDLIWRLSFHVPDWWNSSDLSDFSGTMADFSHMRLMEFHWSDHWNFKMLCIPLFWVWIRLNCIFGLWDTSAMDFKGRNTEKITLQKSFFTTWKLMLFRESRKPEVIGHWLLSSHWAYLRIRVLNGQEVSFNRWDGLLLYLCY